MRWWRGILGGFCLMAAWAVQAQETAPPIQVPAYGPNDTVLVYATVMPDGTLVPTGVLPDAYCIGQMNDYWRKKINSWNRLRKAVYVTYPYAVQAGSAIRKINARLEGVTDKQERKRIILQYEKTLKGSFSDQITKLSVYQGKVLMKLINRETGSDCYEILKEYKGGTNARFWQTVAFVFGSNLRQDYDAQGNDREIEGYVQEIAAFYPKG